jgi:hypothetical protein
VVAPVAGFMMLGNNSNEIIIETDGAPIMNATIVINNVQPNGSILHPSDDLYIRKRVSIKVFHACFQQR